MDNGMSLSDIAAVTRDNDGFGGSNGAWWIVMLLLAQGGGLWGNRQMPNGEPITEAGLCSAMNFNDLQNAVGRLSDNENLHMTQLSQGLASVGYENLRNFASTQQTVQNGDYALAQQLSECCCTTQRAIDGAKYENAQGIAAVNANINEKFAALEKNQLEQTIAAQQNQINQLNLQAQMCGVVRYPNATTYSAGGNPFFGAGCGCGCGAAF